MNCEVSQNFGFRLSSIRPAQVAARRRRFAFHLFRPRFVCTGYVFDLLSKCTHILKCALGRLKAPLVIRHGLAARPLRVRERDTFELFGDYAPDTKLIRVWMRTAVRKEVTSFGTFLSTLSHEFCHHLDFQRFEFPNSWHTRGFYERAAALYHHARASPLKRLFWIPLSRERWRIDWVRTRRGF